MDAGHKDLADVTEFAAKGGAEGELKWWGSIAAVAHGGSWAPWGGHMIGFPGSCIGCGEGHPNPIMINQPYLNPRTLPL
jgi:hypothetical protein